MALVHDVAEAIVGDISPAMNITKEEKQRREEVAPSLSIELWRHTHQLLRRMQ